MKLPTTTFCTKCYMKKGEPFFCSKCFTNIDRHERDLKSLYEYPPKVTNSRR